MHPVYLYQVHFLPLQVICFALCRTALNNRLRGVQTYHQATHLLPCDRKSATGTWSDGYQSNSVLYLVCCLLFFVFNVSLAVYRVDVRKYIVYFVFASQSLFSRSLLFFRLASETVGNSSVRCTKYHGVEYSEFIIWNEEHFIFCAALDYGLFNSILDLLSKKNFLLFLLNHFVYYRVGYLFYLRCGSCYYSCDDYRIFISSHASHKSWTYKSCEHWAFRK